MEKFRFARIKLDTTKPHNNGFFDQASRLHLTRAEPVGVVHVLTPQILLELQGSHPSLIDLDGVIDIKNGCFKDLPEGYSLVGNEEEENANKFAEEFADAIIVENPVEVVDNKKNNRRR